jgi:hypothetical protein
LPSSEPLPLRRTRVPYFWKPTRTTLSSARAAMMLARNRNTRTTSANQAGFASERGMERGMDSMAVS